MPSWPLSLVARVWPVGFVYGDRCSLNARMAFFFKRQMSEKKKKLRCFKMTSLMIMFIQHILESKPDVVNSLGLTFAAVRARLRWEPGLF